MFFRCGPGLLKRFDFAVANPPFSNRAWTNGLNPANDENTRFEYGESPAKNGDYAYLLHLEASLNSTGKGAIIMPHGVLFRGNREAGIRRSFLRHGRIKGVTGTPANLFYGTGIPACIVVIDKEEFKAYRDRVRRVLGDWRQEHAPRLRGLEVGNLPKALIRDPAEDLLRRFAGLPLLNCYDVYKCLMDCLKAQRPMQGRSRRPRSGRDGRWWTTTPKEVTSVAR